MPRVSVIIVNYNGRHFLADLLTSLARQTYSDFEAILVDNASSDGSVDYTRERFTWVNIMEARANLGFAGGNNLGVRHARGEYIALLNPDTRVDPRWLEELVRAMDADSRVGAAVSKIFNADQEGIIDCAGAEFNNLGFYWGRGSNEPDRGQYDSPVEVAGATACAMIIRREALNGEPPFDGRFFAYYEELEMSLRIRGRGYKIIYVPTSIAYHKRSGIVRKETQSPLLFQQTFGNRNRLKILAKYYPASVLLANLPLILLSLAYWNTVFLLRGGPKFFLRAIAGQIRFGIDGFIERLRGDTVDANQWLPWMVHSGLISIAKVRLQRKYVS